MKREWLRNAHVALLFAALSLAAVASAGASRTEAVLSWDDGVWDSINHQVTGRPEQQIAVMFQAPEWACWVTEIHYYIGDDLMSDPQESFLAYVWEPAEGTPTIPGEAANVGVDSGTGYPRDAWLEIPLPEAVNIADASVFPDRVFFVGLEWVTRFEPYLAEDHSDPIDHMSWFFNWAVWVLREDADTMIRAVVTDTWMSPVEDETWSSIKALYR